MQVHEWLGDDGVICLTSVSAASKVRMRARQNVGARNSGR